MFFIFNIRFHPVVPVFEAIFLYEIAKDRLIHHRAATRVEYSLYLHNIKENLCKLPKTPGRILYGSHRSNGQRDMLRKEMGCSFSLLSNTPFSF